MVAICLNEISKVEEQKCKKVDIDSYGTSSFYKQERYHSIIECTVKAFLRI